jgi:type II secretory pathway pseudopilin PulG
MIKSAPNRRPKQPSEEGFALLAVIFLVFLLTIALAVALPKVSKEIQRDRELETMQRGKQYIRGVRMYYKKFGAYPPNIDALVKPTNNIRFLRKKYADPTTGKEDWKPIMFGQNKAPTAMGFFGQPLGGSSIAGVGPGAGGNGLQGNSLGQTTATPDPNAPQDASNSTATTSTTGQSGLTGQTGLTGQSGLTGKTFGGAGIIGFSPNSPKQSIMVYKKKNHYNEWEFVYDPITEQLMSGGNTGTIGQPASSTTTPIGGTPSGAFTTTVPTSTGTPTTTTTP